MLEQARRGTNWCVYARSSIPQTEETPRFIFFLFFLKGEFMKKLLLLGAIALSLGTITGCSPDKEYTMKIIETVKDSTGNVLAHCEPVKTFKFKHYVDIPDLESYEGIDTFIAKVGIKTSYYCLEGGKEVDNGRYEFLRWTNEVKTEGTTGETTEGTEASTTEGTTGETLQ